MTISHRQYYKKMVDNCSPFPTVGQSTPRCFVQNQEHGGEGTAPDVPLGRLGQSTEVANVIVFLLGSEAGYVTGATWAVDGGAKHVAFSLGDTSVVEVRCN